MQASDSQLKQTWFWLGVLAVVGVALIARWALYQERTSLLALRHTYERIICADELRSNLTDNEVWALGFVLTGDPSYLKLYDASEKALDDRADKLRKLVQNDPKQRAHFERLSPLLQRQIAALSETVRPRNAATLDASHAGILTERGTQLMDQIRQIIGEIRNQEQNTLPWLLQKRRSRLRAGFAAIFSSALLAICSLLLARTNLTRNIFRRQRAEEELRTSEKRFEILCEQAPIGIYETDAQGLCVYTNRWWSERSGLNATESLGRGWQKAVHPDDLVEGWEAAALRGAWWEYRLLTTRGDVRWIRASGGPIYSPGGTMTGFVGTLEDITERKQAEQALRERDALNRAVLNSLPANIAVLNGDGIIQVTNEAWRQFAQANGNPPSCSVDTGADYLEVSKRAADAGSEEAAKAFTGIHDVLMGTLQSFEMQYPCHSSSEKRWFHMVVTFLAGVSGGGAVIAHVDVTRRKRSEEALRQSQTQLASDLDAMTRLQKLGTLFVCESNLAVVLDAIADAAIAISRADFGTIQLLDPASSTLKIVAQRGFPSWWIDFWARVFESRGVCGTALERGERVIVEDVEESPIFAGTPALDIQLKAGVRAVQSTPLVSRSGTIIGILSTHYRLPQRPDDRMVQLLDLLALQASDIVERARTEAALRESEERFRNMADTAPVMIWVAGPDKHCTFFNKTWLDFTGRKTEQELGYSWAEGVHPDDHDRCIATYSTAFDARRRFRMEYRLRRADGEFRWVLDDGVPRFTPGGIFAGYIGSCIDITEERRAEEERQKFVSLADRSLEFIGMCDLEFKPFYVNSAGMRLVGLDDLDAACRVKVQDYFFPEDRPFVTKEFFPRVLREGYGEMEIRFRHFKTGEVIWMLWNVFAIFDARGGQVGWGTVSVDITKRKRAERELRESRQKLRALAGRLINAEEAERRRISRELHDDLNQKLALLAFDTASLRQTLPSSENKMREQLYGLEARVIKLSQDVRQISHRLHPSILEDLGLTAALNELCEEFSAREGIEVLFEQEAVPKCLPADVASCLYRVAQEALHNVLKHAHASRVTMKVSGSSSGIHLLIHDLGAGFNSEASRSHHGLGIVNMKERIRLVQGEFSIHSRAGQGTEVRVFVPLPKEAS